MSGCMAANRGATPRNAGGGAESLADFDRFLSDLPLLGLDHAAGRQIADAIRESPRKRLEPSNWFRGLEAQDRRPPKPEDFFPPEPAKVAIPEQRFNHQGQRVFYLSDSPRGAALECKESGTSVIWVQQFATAAIPDVLDLARTAGDRCIAGKAATYCGEVDHGVVRPEHLTPQYRVPRFVADCARRYGVRALLVPSTVEGINCVVFRWEAGDLVPVGDPQQISV